MRKRNKGKMLSRPKSQRQALLNSLANNLFLREKIKTTETKAKELRQVAEKFITRAKSDSVANRRLLSSSLNPEILKKLFSDIAPGYKSLNGGYTRIVKLAPRKSDGAKVAVIELINRKVVETEKVSDLKDKKKK